MLQSDDTSHHSPYQEFPVTSVFDEFLEEEPPTPVHLVWVAGTKSPWARKRGSTATVGLYAECKLTSAYYKFWGSPGTTNNTEFVNVW
jgi:hypothetical protein